MNPTPPPGALAGAATWDGMEAGESVPPARSLECTCGGEGNVILQCVHFDGRVIHLHHRENNAFLYVCVGPDEPAFTQSFSHIGAPDCTRDLYDDESEAIAAFNDAERKLIGGTE